MPRWGSLPIDCVITRRSAPAVEHAAEYDRAARRHEPEAVDPLDSDAVVDHHFGLH